MKVVYNIILTNAGINKLKLISIIRNVRNISLREAKYLIDNTPSIVIGDLTRAKANLIKKELETAGAKVKLEKPLWT